MAYFYGEQDQLLHQHPMEEDYPFLGQMDQLTGNYDWGGGGSGRRSHPRAARRRDYDHSPTYR